MKIFSNTANPFLKRNIFEPSIWLPTTRVKILTLLVKQVVIDSEHKLQLTKLIGDCSMPQVELTGSGHLVLTTRLTEVIRDIYNTGEQIKYF